MTNVLEHIDYYNAFINLGLHTSPRRSESQNMIKSWLFCHRLDGLRICRQLIRPDTSQLTRDLNRLMKMLF